MRNLLFLMVMFMCSTSWATQITFPTVYGPTSQVTNVTLNGDNSAISNVINGNLDNTNANTAGGYRFYQTVSSLPAAGNTGQVYFLTTDDSLNFDTGSTFIKTIGISGSAAQGNIVYYGASGLNYLAVGTSGQVLETQGAAANPVWETLTYASNPNPYIKVSYTVSQNTAGGSSTSGSWLTYPINTKDTDSSSIASLGSNIITLPSGTYNVDGYLTLYNGSTNAAAQSRLYNSTGSAVLLVGQSINKGSADIPYLLPIKGQIVLSGSTNVILQYQVNASQSTNGLGSPSNFGSEVYAQLIFTKIL